ncbi:MAG: FAD-dependent oxidoreductase [Dehalococcoidia bacterium]|nr:FAD-dependent oxidoreductase [Dehalococcoidia bacterium]
MYDLIIIGGGPAAVSAAIYAARYRLDTALVALETGGQVAESWLVENYLGFPSISGVELAQRFEEHLSHHEVRKVEERAEKVVRKDGGFFVAALEGGEELQGRAVIVATGRYPRRLGIPGEAEFLHCGVSYCATCDAPLFADENVAVIGGGDAALQAAAQLILVASRVYLVSRRAWRAEPALQARASGATNLEALVGYVPLEIRGTERVESLVVKATGEHGGRELAVTGVFVEIGAVPDSKLVEGLAELNDAGEIVVDRLGRTSVPGLFAAGDVTDTPYKQAIMAAGDGAKAAMAAWEYLLGVGV